jgi:hypothetical protein
LEERSKREFNRLVREMQLFVGEQTTDIKKVREFIVPGILQEVFELGVREGSSRRNG